MTALTPDSIVLMHGLYRHWWYTYFPINQLSIFNIKDAIYSLATLCECDTFIYNTDVVNVIVGGTEFNLEAGPV